MIKLSNKLKKLLKEVNFKKLFKEVLLYIVSPIITGAFLYISSSYLYDNYNWPAKRIFAIFSVIAGLSSIFWLAIGQLLLDFIKFAVGRARKLKFKDILTRRKNARPG